MIWALNLLRGCCAMTVISMRSAFICLALLLFAARLAADGNLIDIDASDPDRNIVPPAEKDILLDARMAGPGAEENDDLTAAYLRLEQLANDGLLDEADAAAKRLIQLAIESRGMDSTQAATALTNLAIVQHQNAQYDAAQSNYESAIEIIENVEDRLNAALVNPLKGLAAAQLEGGRPDLATTTFRRAVHVTHVNEGPHNLTQLQILQDLSDIQLMMGKVDKSMAIQETIHSVNIRKHGIDSVDLVPSLMRRAEWQHAAGMVMAERDTYRQAIRIIEKQIGKDDNAMVEPLIRLGRSFFFMDTSGQVSFHQPTLSKAEIYLKRAVRIAGNSSDPDWRTIAEATLALGDYYTFDSIPNRARQVYRGAWKLLSENDSSGEKSPMRRDELERPLVLRQQSLPGQIGDSMLFPDHDADDPVREGVVTARFSVTERGRTDDIEIIEAEPVELATMIDAVRSEIRRRIYRPQLAEGEVVRAPGQVLTHTYLFRQSDLDKARKQLAIAAESDS